MGTGAWRAAVHGVAESDSTEQSNTGHKAGQVGAPGATSSRHVRSETGRPRALTRPSWSHRWAFKFHPSHAPQVTAGLPKRTKRGWN